MDNDEEPDDDTPEMGDDEALGEFDDDYGDDRNDPIQPSSTVGKFRRTGAGMVLNGIALGLAEVFEGSLREDPPIVQEAQGEPDTPRHVEAYLDPDDPAASSVVVRSWRAIEAGDADDDATADS